MKHSKPWLLLRQIGVTFMWGLWGALTALMAKNNSTIDLHDTVWAFTMINTCCGGIWS